MKRKYWIILAASVAILLAVIFWPSKAPDLTKQIPNKGELIGMLQEQSQIASTEVTIRKMEFTTPRQRSPRSIRRNGNWASGSA